MSRSVDLFVDPSVDDRQLLVLLGMAAHAAPVPNSEGRYRLHLGADLVADAYRHPFLDDRELHLSRYPWVVSIRVGHDGSLMDHPATAALRMVADDLRPHGCRVLLVHDLQYRIDIGPEPAGAGGTAGPPATQAAPAGDTRGVAAPRPEAAAPRNAGGTAGAAGAGGGR